MTTEALVTFLNPWNHSGVSPRGKNSNPTEACLGQGLHCKNNSGWKTQHVSVLLVWCRPWVHKTRQFNVHQNCFLNSLFLANNYHRGLSQVFQSNVNVGPVQELQWIFCQKHGYCAAVWWQIWLPNFPDFRRQFTNIFFFFYLFIFSFLLTLEFSTRRRGTSSALATWILFFRDPAEFSRKCHRSIRRHRRPDVPHLGEPFLLKV